MHAVKANRAVPGCVYFCIAVQIMRGLFVCNIDEPAGFIGCDLPKATTSFWDDLFYSLFLPTQRTNVSDFYFPNSDSSLSNTRASPSLMGKTQEIADGFGQIAWEKTAVE